MTTGSGGAVPSSSVTRPLTKIGCGKLEGCDGLVVVLVGFVVELVRLVLVVLLLPVFPVPVDGGGVAPPLLWPYAATKRNALVAAKTVNFTQTLGVILPPVT